MQIDNILTPSPHWEGYRQPHDLENFRNNGGSSGLDGGSGVGCDSEDNSALGYFKIIKDVVGKEFLDLVYHNEVGNPLGEVVEGKVSTRSDIQNAYNAWRLWPYLDGKVTEIGAGFCGLAVMLKRLKPDLEIDIIDLPQVRDIQKYYVENTVGLDGFNWIDPAQMSKSDLVINIRSMMEMTPEQVEGYFDLIYKNPPELFYCVNRYYKTTILKEYPFYDRWRPLISTPLLFEPSIHEFLLTPGSGIKRELQTIPPYEIFHGKKHTLTVPVVMQQYEAV